MWASFPHDPRVPELAGLRASDADRDRIQQVVNDAYADGRLDRGEYDERSAAVLGARTLGELPPLVADLVAAVPPTSPARPGTATSALELATPAQLQRRAEEKWRSDRWEAISAFATTTVICWAIWSFFMFGGFPWPLFPTGALLLNLVRVSLSREQVVAEEVRRLERKQAKAIARAREREQPGE
ncbi:DUF1707 domain-containing protein [Nocardioides sp. YIM 123512]|uniref:DUF1707 domain-containing protein n=1 Tax=Nocardioides flavescens TaxID=2691959 RepID=A0A6L7EY60_9ACTN|nr:DUF1707 domain-containing protein [Nocardioides flavescens]